MTRDEGSHEISEVDLNRAFSEYRDDPDRLASVVERTLAQPHAEAVYFVADVLVDLAEVYAEAGRVDEAIAVHERAMAAGYEATPHPRMNEARWLAGAGRVEEMRRIHEAVVAADPDDVWFYNAAGMNGHLRAWHRGARSRARSAASVRFADVTNTFSSSATTAFA